MTKLKVLKKVLFKFMLIKKDLDSRMSVCRQVVCSKICGGWDRECSTSIGLKVKANRIQIP